MEAAWTELRWGALSDQEREREYSPSSCLPDGDYRPFITAYREQSDRAWADVGGNAAVVTQVLTYDPTHGYTLDLAVPVEAGRPPIVVFIHGGYWQELSSRDSRFSATRCVELGWAFAAIDYPLAPNATIDEIVAACSDAVAKLHADADELGFDRDRIIVAGSSAGAHLAAMVALRSPGVVAGTVLISGVFELAPLIGTTVNEAVGMDLDAAHRNSPLRHDVASFGPTVVAYGSNETDQFKAQSAVFAGHLIAGGSEADVLEIAGRNHFDVVVDLVEPGTMLGDAVAALVEATGTAPSAAS